MSETVLDILSRGLVGAEARNRNSNRNRKKKNNGKAQKQKFALCESQGPACQALALASCGEDAGCQAAAAQCCEQLEICEFTAFITCINQAVV